MSTKTSGAFGEGDAPAVSMGMVGNAHPALVVPMERGDLGVNHAAAKDRRPPESVFTGTVLFSFPLA